MRPDKNDPASLAFDTAAVHAGNRTDLGDGAIRTPLVMANSYLLPEDPADIDWSGTDLTLYARNGGINQHGLERKLTVLDGGEAAVVLGSGVAALHAVFFTFLGSGDHVVVADVTYEATWRLFDSLLSDKYGIEATFVDASDPAAVRAAMRPNTRLVHTEVIGNPTTKVSDIAALAAIAHESGALLSVDSTFTPPPLYRPLTDGADLVVHSLTKYINGHGDAMGGAVIGSAELIGRIRSEAQVDVGGVISPFNAWLIMRGSVTLPLRLERQLVSARVVAEALAAHPRVAWVDFPGLGGHDQHEVATRQFGGRGFGAMMAFAVDGPPASQDDFVARLRVVTSAVSLGHDETLIVHVGGDGPRARHYPQRYRDRGHLRLSIGLEDPADLVADLTSALDEFTDPGRSAS